MFDITFAKRDSRHFSFLPQQNKMCQASKQASKQEKKKEKKKNHTAHIPSFFYGSQRGLFGPPPPPPHTHLAWSLLLVGFTRHSCKL